MSVTKVTFGTLTALRRIPYLAGLTDAELAALAQASVHRAAARGQTVFEEGTPAAGVFVVLEGRVKLVRRSRAGREQILHVEGPGATLAEVPVFDGGGYVASAVADAPVRLLFVPRTALLSLCRRDPSVALGIVAVLARRLRTFAGLIEDLALRDVTARLARVIRAEAETDAGVVRLGTREDLATRIGTVRELVSRALSRLVREGALERRGRHVRVRDARRLRTLGEPTQAKRAR